MENPYSDLFNEAQNDNNTAATLFNAKNYPAAVFYYQQAVEKACKFWGLSQQLITWVEIRSIGHKPDKIFRILFKKIDGTNKTFEFDKTFDNLYKLPNMDDRVRQILGNIYQIISNPVIPIAKGQSPYEAVATFFSNDPKVAELHPGIAQDIERYRNHGLRDLIAKDFLDDTENICKMPVCLMMLSFLVYDTEQNARYPDIQKNVKPKDLYNENTLFVQQLPEFLFDFLNHNLSILHHYYIKTYKGTPLPFQKHNKIE